MTINLLKYCSILGKRNTYSEDWSIGRSRWNIGKLNRCPFSKRTHLFGEELGSIPYLFVFIINEWIRCGVFFHVVMNVFENCHHLDENFENAQILFQQVLNN